MDSRKEWMGWDGDGWISGIVESDGMAGGWSSHYWDGASHYWDLLGFLVMVGVILLYGRPLGREGGDIEAGGAWRGV